MFSFFLRSRPRRQPNCLSFEPKSLENVQFGISLRLSLFQETLNLLVLAIKFRNITFKMGLL